MKNELMGLLLLLTTLAHGEKGDAEAYIKKYKDVAIREMHMYGIPASITLAQGMLESGNGKSYLATKANNHFGIKCHKGWTGDRVYHDDDAKNECFRSYKNANESFKDHSLFLKHRSRYAFLFDESPTDYKAWAKGLKKAGYATNPRYPELLISLIERHKLHKYDLKGSGDYRKIPKEEGEFEVELFQRQVSSNHVKYILVKEGDNLEMIASELEVPVSKILKYNEFNYEHQIRKGERLYYQPKRRKAAVEHVRHEVAEGETMHDIAQQYAIRLDRLYKINGMAVGSQPAKGEILLLR